MLCMIMAMADSPKDRKKVEALYHKYDRLMYYIAGKILSRHEDIEDAVMEAWIRIIRNLDKISEISSPKTKNYLVIIVERTSIDVYNRNSKKNGNEVSISEYEQSPYFSSIDVDLEDVETYECLRSLPKKFSEPLILYYMQEMSVKEIAKALALSEDAVYKRIQRGREELVRRWDQ